MRNKSAIIGLSFFIALNICMTAKAHDACKDILRDGVRDEIYKHNSLDKRIIEHNQFCSIAKETELNEDNFEDFARKFAQVLKSDDNSYGGGAGIGIKLFNFDANYNQTNNSSDLTEEEKIALLKTNKRKLLDYFFQNCGDQSYEEALKSEAVLLTKIANKDIVDAWRECMVNKTGFFVDVTPSTSELDENELEYTLMISWKTNENIKITSICLQYEESKVKAGYKIEHQNSGIVLSGNLCKFFDVKLRNGDSLPIKIIHSDRTRSANVEIIAKTSTKSAKSYTVTLPKMIIPEPLILDLPPEPSVSENSFFAVEHFCDNDKCNEYRKVVDPKKYTISEEFLVNINQLNYGTCEKCETLKNVRFCFKNCRYKFKGKTSYGDLVEKMENIANENFRYFYPFDDGRNFYSKIRILTGTIDGPSLESNQF